MRVKLARNEFVGAVRIIHHIQWLYPQQDQERLERQWAQHQQHQARTDKTKDVLLAAKDRQIKALEEENRKLKEERKELYGKLYERI